MSTKLKPIPTFASEEEEHQFWQMHDSTEYVDWSKAERVRLPSLKSSTTTISLRMPISVLERIKIAANKRDMPYQTLIKSWLAEKVEPVPDAARKTGPAKHGRDWGVTANNAHQGLEEAPGKFRSAAKSARRPKPK
jgi:predicted DNA binding CopG/RHH family protein